MYVQINNKNGKFLYTKLNNCVHLARFERNVSFCVQICNELMLFVLCAFALRAFAWNLYMN